jgi:Tol biopolymer transport system component
MKRPATSIALGLSLVSVWTLSLSAASQAQAAPTQRWTPAALSSDAYESSPTFSPDGAELVFMRADRSFGNYRLLASRCQAGQWGAPVPPAFAAPAPALEGDPFFSADGKRLYFISNRHAPHVADDLDIWRVDRLPDGAWGKPLRLPAPVNSSASELLPREDGQGRLWFGSSRPGGHGQGDIYFATPLPGGGWRVDNAGPPVSTPANEYEAEISQNGRTLVVVADRGDRSHLYRFRRADDGRWAEQGRVDARGDVFQVGPLLSPKGERLLFAQADAADGGRLSGEWFVTDLVPGSTELWPPACER